MVGRKQWQDVIDHAFEPEVLRMSLFSMSTWQLARDDAWDAWDLGWHYKASPFDHYARVEDAVFMMRGGFFIEQVMFDGPTVDRENKPDVVELRSRPSTYAGRSDVLDGDHQDQPPVSDYADDVGPVYQWHRTEPPSKASLDEALAVIADLLECETWELSDRALSQPSSSELIASYRIVDADATAIDLGDWMRNHEPSVSDLADAELEALVERYASMAAAERYVPVWRQSWGRRALDSYFQHLRANSSEAADDAPYRNANPGDDWFGLDA